MVGLFFNYKLFLPLQDPQHLWKIQQHLALQGFPPFASRSEITRSGKKDEVMRGILQIDAYQEAVQTDDLDRPIQTHQKLKGG